MQYINNKQNHQGNKKYNRKVIIYMKSMKNNNMKMIKIMD